MSSIEFECPWCGYFNEKYIPDCKNIKTGAHCVKCDGLIDLETDEFGKIKELKRKWG